MLARCLPWCCLGLAAAAFAQETAAPAVRTPPTIAVTPPDALHLAGGDRLHGRFEGYTAASGLTWRHPAGLAPLQFAPGSLDRIEWQPKLGAEGGANMWVALANGDLLRGKLVAYTPKQTVLETPAGRFAFDSAAVRALGPLAQGGGQGFNGIGREEDWKLLKVDGNHGTMKLADGKMVLSENPVVVREAVFGQKFRLELEFEGTKGVPILGFLLDTDEEAKITARQCSFYAVICRGGGAEVMRISPKEGRGNAGDFQPLGQLDFQFKPDTNRLAVAVDAEARTMAFFLNDQPIGEVKDPAPFLTGKHLVLGNSHDGVLTITGLSLSGGQFASGGVNIKTPATATDHLLLANQDQTSGQLLFIRDGKASFKTEFAILEIPLERIASLGLSHPPLPAKPADDGGAVPDARIFFQDGTCLTLRLASVKAGKVTGCSPVLGHGQWPANGLQKIQFNLNAPFRRPTAEPKKQSGVSGIPPDGR